MITWKKFTAIPNGTRVLNHGWDQCVALANLYHEDVIDGSFVPVGSAYQWWTQFDRFKTLTDNYTQSPTPVPGAIFVARYGLYDAPNGHIGVVTHVSPDGSFSTMEQNAGTWRYVGRYSRSRANVLGFLIPKKNPATPKTATAKGTKMAQKYKVRDAKARGGGRTVKPGQYVYAHSSKNAGPTNASNCVGKVGDYTFIAHIEAKGKPGDAIGLRYVWKAKGKTSVHFNEHLVFPSTGVISTSIPFTRSVASGDAVYLRLHSRAKNKGTVKVTHLDSDATLWK